MKVSVVIPVYNGARFISGLMESLQGIDPDGYELEFIVVDDGSTDDTAERLAQYPVQVISQANAGPASARNAGWRKADGDIVVFTDADCRPGKLWIRSLMEGFSDATVGAVAGSYDIANPESALSRVIHTEIIHRHNQLQDFVRVAGTYNLAIRRQCLEMLNGFDESYPAASGEDNDLSYRLQKAGFRIAFRPRARVAHYHPEGLGKYLKTQFVHGYWRGRLYLIHPQFLAGDDYTRPRDILGSFLAAVSLASILPSIFLSGWWHLLPVLFLMLILGLEGICALELAIRNRDWILFPLGTITFSVRAYYRVTGALIGVLSNLRQMVLATDRGNT